MVEESRFTALDFCPKIKENTLVSVTSVYQMKLIGEVSWGILLEDDHLSAPETNWHVQLDDIPDFLGSFQHHRERMGAW